MNKQVVQMNKKVVQMNKTIVQINKKKIVQMYKNSSNEKNVQMNI